MEIPGIHLTGHVWYRVVTGTLGMLCVLLLTVVIVLSVERLHLNSTCSNCPSERDLLQTNLKTLQKENTEVKSQISDLERHMQDGWIFFASSFYYLSTEVRSWDVARKDCQNRGADLVIINNRDEQDFLFRMQKEFWIGLIKKDGLWKWVDGTALTDGFWDDGQPNNYVGEEDCAEIRESDYINNWNDDLCSRLELWLCEKIRL
ncbi:CD209 antigen-like protein E [Alosa sapidissima]|uniref:CD209 antigen-like protein E n=1 Tax=Alosa sapidissima TaxID=34773 RepID=UPI001C08E080|nr:CD209 antigen-like protein E [Alosa sapidissima]